MRLKSEEKKKEAKIRRKKPERPKRMTFFEGQRAEKAASSSRSNTRKAVRSREISTAPRGRRSRIQASWTFKRPERMLQTNPSKPGKILKRRKNSKVESIPITKSVKNQRREA